MVAALVVVDGILRDALDDVETLEDEGLSFVDQRDEFTSGEREKAFRAFARAANLKPDYKPAVEGMRRTAAGGGTALGAT